MQLKQRGTYIKALKGKGGCYYLKNTKLNEFFIKECFPLLSWRNVSFVGIQPASQTFRHTGSIPLMKLGCLEGFKLKWMFHGHRGAANLTQKPSALAELLSSHDFHFIDLFPFC